jgi:hypothetical protein
LNVCAAKRVFDGSYDSVKNYIRPSVRDDEKLWEKAYDLIVRLPKVRALDFIRLLWRGKPSIRTFARLRPIEAASNRKAPIANGNA